MAEVFLLGAGFSKAISEHMPLLADLSRKVRLRNSLRANSPIWDMFEDDLEMWLTYLSQSHPWLSESENLRNRALFLDLSHKIADELEKCEHLATQDFPPDWLSTLIQWWHERKAVVITLDYDILIERAVAKADISQDGGTVYCDDLYPVTLTPAVSRKAKSFAWGKHLSSFKLFKLHGSINWFYSGAATFYGETIYYTLPHEETPEEVRDKVPFVVPPLTEKGPYFQHETIRTLWAQAADALKEATHIFCLGYSLPQTDISLRFFLQANAPQRKAPFFIVNLPSGEIADHFRALLPNYDVRDQFISDDPIPRLVEDHTAGRI